MRSLWIALLVVGCGSAEDSTTQTPTAQPPVTAASLVFTPVMGLSFGTVIIGQTSTEVVRVYNSGGTTATQLSFDLAQTDFTYEGGSYPGNGGTCGQTLKSKASCTVALLYQPIAAGSSSDLLTASFFDGKESQSVSLALTGVAQGTSAPSAPTNLTGRAGADGVYDQDVEALGTFTTTSTGATPVITATKRSADDAILIVAMTSSHYLMIDELKAPSGQTITSLDYIDSAGNFTAQMLNRAYPGYGVHAVMIPQTPNVAAITGPGAYPFKMVALTASGFGAPGVDVEVFVLHQPAALTQIDVNLFFSGSAGMTAANAPSNVNFQKIVTQLETLWGGLGITVANLRYIDLPAGYQNVVEQAGLQALFLQSAAHPKGLNFFFVNDITVNGMDSSTGLLGLDGAIPAPGAFMGTVQSGAAVILDVLPTKTADLNQLGTVLAHEGGHYLGLYHVEESDGTFDNLSDTPTNLTNKLNVMYWSSNGDPAQAQFTTQQAQTVRRHPLVH